MPNPNATQTSTSLSQFGTALVKYWPIIVGFIVILAGGLETRYQVQQLIGEKAQASKENEDKQWGEITRTAAKQAILATNFQNFRNEMAAITTNQERQTWGYVKLQVPKNAHDIEEIKEELASMR